MTRGQLPKAYLRMDPNIDHTHPDNLDGFVRLLCAANRQPHRGWFRDRKTLDQVLGKRLVDRLYARGDVVEDESGVRVPGWDAWQEGDWTVADRMRRIRSKDSTPVTRASLERNDVTGNDPAITVTRPSHDRIAPSEASRRLGVKALSTSSPPTLSEGRAPDVSKRNGKANGFGTLLTAEQYAAWSTFTDECWSKFKAAWLARGFRHPPFGDPEDDPGTSQRSRLYAIAQDCPTWIAQWVSEAPGKTAHDVIAYIFDKRAEMAADAGLEEAETAAETAERNRDRRPLRRLGEIMPEALDELGF